MNKQTKIDFSLRDRSLFESEKIVIRKTGDKLIASYDNNNFYFDTLVHGIYKKSNEVDLFTFLAILNSKPATYFYRCLHNIKGKVFATISLEDIANFPIPDINNPECANSSLLTSLSSLAHKMLALNADLQKTLQRFLKRVQENLHPAKISAPLEAFYTLEFADFVKELAKQKAPLSLKQQDEWEDYFADYKAACQAVAADIATTDHQINQLVYKLYGLTEEEIAVVEGR